ncbi:MAG: Ig-like domain-containing protein [Planctomycetota bacterium]
MFEALEPRTLLSVGALGTDTIILDNGDAGFQTAGTWSTVSSAGYDGDVQTSRNGSATWTFDDLDPGYRYRLSVTWPGTNGGEAAYTIVDHEADGRRTTVDTITLNQGTRPNDLNDAGTAWEDLGDPVLIRGTTLSVTLDGDDSRVSADALRLERVGAWVPPIGVAMPEFGIEESHWMYAQSGKTFDYGNGPEPYRMADDGPYTHYVDNTHPNATDSHNPFGTPETPRRSIPNRVPAGSVVEIHGGSYTNCNASGRTMLAGVGSKDKPIVFRGADNDAMPRINGMTTLGHYAEARWMIVENMDFANVEVRGLNDHLSFRHNTISRGGTGLRMSGDTSSEWIEDMVIYNNTIHDNGDWTASYANDVHGITVNRYINNVWAVDNHSYHNGGDSIQVNCRGSWNTTNIYIGRNIFHHDRENAVDLKTYKDVIVSENRMYGYRSTSSSEGAAFVVHYNPRWTWVLNNEIYDAEWGLANTGSTDTYFIGNLIYDIHRNGVRDPASVYAHGKGIHVRNSARTDIINNTIFNTGTAIGSANTPLSIMNNIIANRNESYGYDIQFDDSTAASNSRMNNNLVYGPDGVRIKWGGTYSSLADFQAATGKGDGSYEGDPRFVSEANRDFRLTADSPAIDAGVDIQWYSDRFESRYGMPLDVDMKMAERVFGEAIDMGAIETGADQVTPNTPPECLATPITIDEDTTGTGAFTGIDADGDTLTFRLIDAPAHGEAVVNSDGTFTYTPEENFNGIDTFTVVSHDGRSDSALATQTITVTPVNDAPVAPEQLELATRSGMPVSGAVEAYDVDGDALVYAVGQDAAHGKVELGDAGAFTYTPDAGWSGTDQFTLRVSDGTVSVPVAVQVLVGDPSLSVTTDALTFDAQTGTLAFGVANSGQSILEYTVETSEPWLAAAPVDGTSTGETDTIAVTVDRAGLEAGSYTGTITVNGGDAGSSQIAVTLEVPQTADRTLIEVGDTWHYRKGDTAPAAEWAEAGFDDSVWAEGLSGIGYSTDVDYATTLDDMRGNYTSFFARRTFNVDDPAAVMNLAMDIAYDDAFVAYLNGVEVARSASMGGQVGEPVAYDALSAGMHEELDPAESFAIAADGLLTAGENVLAIQVVNVDLNSSDILMAPRLQAAVALVGDPVLAVGTDAMAFDAATDGLEVTVANSGDGLLTYTVETSEPWLAAAPVDGTSTGETDTIAVTVDRAGLEAGSYTGTITVNGGDAGSSQIAVTLEVPQTADRTLIEVGDTWHYRKGDTAPAAEWAEAGFDDSVWAEGLSGIGYSTDVDYATTLDDMRGNYTSFFARRTFNVDDPAAVMNLAMDIAYDDAFVAYLNGVEVARSASMGGQVGEPVAYDALSAGMHEELDPAESFAIAADGLLTAGENVLAIQVVNVDLNSSDILMAPRLQATVIGEPLTGDLNGDGAVDMSDVDLLTAAIRGETTVDGADLNDDGALDDADLALMVRDVIGTEMGDANFDGNIDLADFTLLKQNLGISDASWAQGDFNGDGVSDLDDFALLKSHFGFESSTSASSDDLRTVDLLAVDLDPLQSPLA